MNKSFKKKAFFILLLVLIITLTASCSADNIIAKIYAYDSESKQCTKLYKSIKENDQDFIIELINNKTINGDATGLEKPNYAIVYNEGKDGQYTYLLIVDLETDVIAYITDTYNETTAAKVYISDTKSLDFYDYIMGKK